MEVSIKKLPQSEVEVTIEIPTSDFEQYSKKALAEIAKDLEIKGFRKGHVPLDVVKKEVGEAEILAKAADFAIQESYSKAVRDNNLEVINKAEVEILKLAPNNPFSFKAKCTILPEIKLPNYRKIVSSVKEEKVSIEEKEISEALKWLQQSKAKFTALEREAKEGDFIEIEYSSPEIDGGQKKHDAFILKKGHLMPGFEENLGGMKANQEKEFFIEVPKDYFAKELAGKKIKFQAKMKSVLKMELPDLNDDFAKGLGKFDNIESLKKNIKEGIEKEKQMKEGQRRRGEMIEKVSKEIEWELPQGLLNAEKERLLEQFKASFVQNQLSFKDYLSKTKKTEEEIKDSFKEHAENNIKTFLILREIAKGEEIKVTDQEIEDEINKSLSMHTEESKKNLDLERMKQYTKEKLTNEKVFELLEGLVKK